MTTDRTRPPVPRQPVRWHTGGPGGARRLINRLRARVAEQRRTFVRRAPEASVPLCVRLAACQPALGQTGVGGAPEIKYGLRAVLSQEPRRKAEAKIDADNHARRFAREFQEPSSHLVATAAVFERETMTAVIAPRPYAGEDVPPLPGEVDSS